MNRLRNVWYQPKHAIFLYLCVSLHLSSTFKRFTTKLRKSNDCLIWLYTYIYKEGEWAVVAVYSDRWPVGSRGEFARHSGRTLLRSVKEGVCCFLLDAGGWREKFVLSRGGEQLIFSAKNERTLTVLFARFSALRLIVRGPEKKNNRRFGDSLPFKACSTCSTV